MLDLAPQSAPARDAAAARDQRELSALRARRTTGRTGPIPGGGGEAGGPESWLTTYTDMVTLLLTLFVFLVALSDLHQDKVEDRALDQPTPEAAASTVAAGPTSATAPAAAPHLPGTPPAPPAAREPGHDPTVALAMADLVPAETVPPDVAWLRDRAAELEAFALHHDLARAMTVERTERALVVQLQDGILFPSARADLTVAGQGVVRRLAGLLSGLPGGIEVEGHTDSIPIDTPRFPSNWELSAARAASVVRKLIDNGVPADRIKAVGRADTDPVAGNDTATGRAANRRVTLLILARSPAKPGAPAARAPLPLPPPTLLETEP